MGVLIANTMQAHNSLPYLPTLEAISMIAEERFCSKKEQHKINSINFIVTIIINLLHESFLGETSEEFLHIAVVVCCGRDWIDFRKMRGVLCVN
jgi:hypothetical protein